MDKLSVIQADHDAAAPFQGPLADWFRGKRTLAELLPEAFAAHRIASQAELVEALEQAEYALHLAIDEAPTGTLRDHLTKEQEKVAAALSHTKGESK